MDKKLLLVALAALSTFTPLEADTVYFKNGQSIEGIVKSEDDEVVDLEICLGGTVEFYKKEIERIEKSAPEQSAGLRQKWEAQDRENREKLLQRQLAQEQELKKEVSENKDKQAEFAEDTQNIIVYATLNEKVSAKLILDTGASMVVLKKKIAEKLGIKLQEVKLDARLILADGRKVGAKYLVLDKVKAEGQEAEHIEAAVMLEDTGNAPAGDGLLGMSFLKRFNFKVDHKNKKLILEKIQQ
jgi:clan AA aspartic protease (TIGR02281 family)